MTRSCGTPGVWAVFAALLLGPAGAEARAQSSGGMAPRTTATQAPLTMAVSMFSAFEPGSTAGDGVPREQGQLNVSLGYARQTRRHTLNLSAATVVPYTDGVQRTRLSYAGALSFSSRLGRRTLFEATQSVTEQPFNLGSLTGLSQRDGSRPLDVSRTHGGLFANRETRHDGAISLTHMLGPRGSAVLSYANTGSRSRGMRPSGSQLLAIRFDRRVSASAVLHAGYGFGSASFATADAEAGTRHDLDLGIGFDGRLPFSPRTTFAAGTGSTIVTDGARRRLRLVVDGTLARALGPRWSTRLGYSRPMQFVAGFRQPLLSDAVHLSLDGRVAGGWTVSLLSDAARGSVGFDSGGRRFRSYTGSVRLQKQVARQWRIEVESFASSFRFSGGNGTGSPLPAEMFRRGIRAGLSWSGGLGRR